MHACSLSQAQRLLDYGREKKTKKNKHKNKKQKTAACSLGVACECEARPSSGPTMCLTMSCVYVQVGIASNRRHGISPSPSRHRATQPPRPATPTTSRGTETNTGCGVRSHRARSRLEWGPTRTTATGQSLSYGWQTPSSQPHPPHSTARRIPWLAAGTPRREQLGLSCGPRSSSQRSPEAQTGSCLARYAPPPGQGRDRRVEPAIPLALARSRSTVLRAYELLPCHPPHVGMYLAVPAPTLSRRSMPLITPGGAIWDGGSRRGSRRRREARCAVG
jgi:hypothetical protein